MEHSVIERSVERKEGMGSVTLGLIEVIETWNGLPRCVVEARYQDCIDKCAIVYRHYKQQKRRMLTELETLTGLNTDLGNENTTLQRRLSELEHLFSREHDKLEEVLCSYNALLNKHRRLIGSIPIPILQPIQRPASARNLSVSFPLQSSVLKKQRRRSECELLFE